MSKKVKVTPEEKEFLVLKYIELNVSLSEFCRMFAVERTAIHRWCIKYDAEGSEGLKEIKMKTYYSSDTLLNSVEEYLSNKISMLQIVKKYNLSGDSVLRTWLKWYNTPKWKIKLGVFMARKKI
ncbi:MAG: helix-turn-helix domain-containing protein [Cetobacterium sp.]